MNPNGTPNGIPNGRETERRLAAFDIASEPGNERLAMDEVAGAVADAGLSERKYERLKTAVAETMMNAIEHGNEFDPRKLARVEVSSSEEDVFVRITDEGRGPLDADREAPDLDAKLGGEQTSRGWGLFLIRNMADEMNITGDESHHTVELVFHIDGATERRKQNGKEACDGNQGDQASGGGGRLPGWDGGDEDAG